MDKDRFDVTMKLFNQIFEVRELEVKYRPEKYRLAGKKIRAYKQLFNFSKTLLKKNHDLIDDEVLNTFENTMTVGLKNRSDSNIVNDQLIMLMESILNLLKNNNIETLNT